VSANENISGARANDATIPPEQLTAPPDEEEMAGGLGYELFCLLIPKSGLFAGKPWGMSDFPLGMRKTAGRLRRFYM
jgi:hypothetical protein